MICYIISGYPESPRPISVNYNNAVGHYGASRAFPAVEPSYLGTQVYAAQQGALGKPYNPSSAYQPHHYQNQHLIGTY